MLHAPGEPRRRTGCGSRWFDGRWRVMPPQPISKGLTCLLFLRFTMMSWRNRQATARRDLSGRLQQENPFHDFLEFSADC
jgi:hypothetical protein